jgi:hypothetical protein
MEQELNPETKHLLTDLLESGLVYHRRAAAKKIGELPFSHPEIVTALMIAKDTDQDEDVRRISAEVLLSTSHQEILSNNPSILARVVRLKDIRVEIEKRKPGQVASEWRRLLNFIIDSLILWGIHGLFELAEVNLLLLFLYYFLFETIFAKTPGKLITGTEVVTWEGEKPSMGKIFWRTLIRFIPFEPISSLGMPKNDRNWWHDRWVQTQVVQS